MTRLPVWAFLPALAAALLAADPAEVKEPLDNSPVTVYTHFDQPCSKISVKGMKEEIEDIMRPAGLNVEWRSLDAARGEESAAELVVVSFKGTCAMDELDLTAASPYVALGSTQVTDGAVLPFADIYCDRIRNLIEPRVKSEDVETRYKLLGRAMGRVLAHELYHVLARTTRHASSGLAKPFYNAADLVGQKFEFRDKETSTLRRLRERLDLQAAPSVSQAGAH